MCRAASHDRESRRAGRRAGADRCSSRSCLPGVAGRQQKRIPVAHLAGDAELQDQRFQPGDRVQARQIGPRCPLKTIDFGQLRQRAVDFPQQHRGRGGGAAAPGKLAVDDDDIEPLARQALGDQRSGDAAADDQRIAFQVLADIEANRMLTRGKPRRAAAAKVGLFGIVCIKNADSEPRTLAAGRTADRGTGTCLQRFPGSTRPTNSGSVLSWIRSAKARDRRHALTGVL